MNITIVGAGNIGTQFAVHCAAKGHKVIIYTNNYLKINKELYIVDEKEEIINKGKISAATNDKELAFGNSDLIFITLPAFCMKNFANEIYSFIKENAYIGLIPGTGGGECAFYKFLDKGCTIFGLQRVPSVARLLEYGKAVKAVGYRNELHIATIPNLKINIIRDIIENIFDIKCTELPCYLNITLTPSNPILHTSRLYSLFKDYKADATYKEIPLFYQDWNNETSEILLKCDEEVQKICKKLSMFDLSYVKSLKIHYESDTPEALTKKIKSIKGFQGIETPNIKLNEKMYKPDFTSRYFTADFPYGIFIYKEIANFLCMQTPYIDKIIDWYKKLRIVGDEFKYADYKINNLEQFIEFYKN